MNNKTKTMLFFIGFLLIGLIIISLSLSIGSIYIPFKQLIRVLFSAESGSTYGLIVKNIRLPRVILSLLVGSGLALAGAVFQGVIRNPMVDPYVVGISSGAGTAVTLTIILNIDWEFLGISTIPLMAFIGAVITVYIVYSLSYSKRGLPVITFLLAGVAMGFLLNAVMSFLMVLGTNSLHKVVYWLMGSLATASWQEIITILPYYFTALLIIIFHINDLNTLLLGEENAYNLGLDIERVKLHLIIAAALMTAAVVSVSGIIGFIGLIVPHIVRILIGPDHRKMIPAAALLGGLFLLVSDNLARTLLAPMEIPVGIITALAGGPYFIYLLRKTKGEYW
ncbi:MAG: iron chelate uptake ABC transporter family permease subunit [Firmicutes bacterium]|nr:iron chelate uptake ABC transporter family permease subunit [Bacillota bacterium]